MSIEEKDIVCLSTHYWDERWFRKQEFMNRFGTANRVLYVEPSFSLVREPETHLAPFAQNQPFRPRLESRGRNLLLLKPPRGLPFWSHPTISWANYLRFGLIVRRAMSRLGFKEAILWVYQAAYAPAISVIPHQTLVFDLVDDLPGYLGSAGPQVTAAERRVAKLVQASTLFVTTSPTLLERYGSEARSAVLVPNGFDSRSFNTDRVWPEPAELHGVERPVIGLVGTLFSFLDFDLLREIARRHRDMTLVLIGPVETNAHTDVERLKSEPNVLVLPPVSRDEVPRYLAHFDVCLNVFKPGRVADSVSPLKVYEYLAMGKPVISTPMRGLQRDEAGALVRFADGPDAFSAAIDQALTERPVAASNLIARYSWDSLFSRLESACEALF